MEDKRKNKRLHLEGEILLQPLGKSGEAVSTKIEITDCSKDGLGFSSDAQLTIGDNYEANLTLWTKETMTVFLQIVRASKVDDLFHYGSIFIGMPDSERMRIQVYETVEDQLKEQSDNK
jgi:hypothetical protein